MLFRSFVGFPANLILVSVNNAGFVYGTERVGEIAPSDYEAMFATNVFGLIAMTQLLIKSTRPSPLHLPKHLLNAHRVQGEEIRARY